MQLYLQRDEATLMRTLNRRCAAFERTLRDCGFADLTEGTLYPLLLRLERKGLIAAEYRAGSGGPSRKYYRLTPDGVQYLNEFTEAWQNASDTVNRILHDKEG